MLGLITMLLALQQTNNEKRQANKAQATIQRECNYNVMMTYVRNVPPGGVNRALRVEFEIDQVSDQLKVPLGLHETPHVTEHAVERVVAGTRGQTRNNRVVGAFAGGKRVGVRRLQGEVGTPVVQGEAAAFRHNACSKAHVVRVNHTAPITVLIDAAEIDSVTVGKCR